MPQLWNSNVTGSRWHTMKWLKFSCHFTWVVTHETCQSSGSQLIFHKVKTFWASVQTAKLLWFRSGPHQLRSPGPQYPMEWFWMVSQIFASWVVIIWCCNYMFWPLREIGFKAKTTGGMGCTVVQPSNLTLTDSKPYFFFFFFLLPCGQVVLTMWLCKLISFPTQRVLHILIPGRCIQPGTHTLQRLCVTCKALPGRKPF